MGSTVKSINKLHNNKVKIEENKDTQIDNSNNKEDSSNGNTDKEFIKNYIIYD